jgi:hypothetical protein
MASEKKPSIYSDRGTIGSSDELDEYGVWVKSEPQDFSSASAESQESAESPMPAIEELPDFDADFDDGSDFSIPDADASIDTSDDSFALDDEPLGIPDLDIPEEPVSPDGDEDGSPDIDNFDMDDFSLAEEPEESPESSSAEEGFTEVSIEDFLGATSDNFEEAGLALKGRGDSGDEAPPAYEVPPAEEKPAADLSTQLLMKIADELSSIRTELATLKLEFSAIREEAADDKGDAQKKGFFDEEEDEKIALTGDELDNILNTADFTEEAGADATEELAGDFPAMEAEENDISGSFQAAEESPLPDLLSDQEDIIGGKAEEGPEEETESDIDIELSLDQPDVEELGGDSVVQEQASPDADLSFDTQEFDIDLDASSLIDETAAETPDVPVENLDDSEDLRQLREEGALPLTPAPEDTSYLDAETPEGDSGETIEELSLDDVSLEETAIDEDSIDLTGAVIDEPDLSGEIVENLLEEPSLEDLVLEDLVLEDIPESTSIDLDMEDENPADSSESALLEDLTLPEAGEGEEELELSIPEEDTIETAGTPEEESFAQVIPEGFVVEADDSPVPFDDDPEEADVLSEGDIDTLERSGEIKEEADEGAGEAGDGEEFLSEDEGLDIPSNIKQELKTVLSYMDQLLESLPEDKIEEFAKSEYFDTYKKLFKELGLV